MNNLRRNTITSMEVAEMVGKEHSKLLRDIRELGTYEYDKKSIEKGKEVPVKENDHGVDALRYAVMTAWRYIKQWLPTEIIDDKEYIVDIARKEVEEDGYI